MRINVALPKGTISEMFAEDLTCGANSTRRNHGYTSMTLSIRRAELSRNEKLLSSFLRWRSTPRAHPTFYEAPCQARTAKSAPKVRKRSPHPPSGPPAEKKIKLR
jgi:hypothetical protein